MFFLEILHIYICIFENKTLKTKEFKLKFQNIYRRRVFLKNQGYFGEITSEEWVLIQVLRKCSSFETRIEKYNVMDQHGCRMDCPNYLKTIFGIFCNFNLKLDNETQIWIWTMDPNPKSSRTYKMNLISVKLEK